MYPYPYPAASPAAPAAPAQPQQPPAAGQAPTHAPAQAPPGGQAYPAASQAPQYYDPSLYQSQPAQMNGGPASSTPSAYPPVPYAPAAAPSASLPAVVTASERKRPYENTGAGQDGREHKRPQVEASNGADRETVYRILVPASRVGAVIGKQGAIVREIRLQTKSRIRVCEGVREWEERVVVVSAKDASREDTNQAQCALMEVHKRVLDARQSVKPEGEGEAANPGQLSTRMLVNRTQAGSIIGKGGSIIKNIRETTGASVKILPPEDLPPCALLNDRVVQITGTTEQLTAGVVMVARQIRDNPPKEMPGGPPPSVPVLNEFYTYPPAAYPPPQPLQYPPHPHQGVPPPAPVYQPPVPSYAPAYAPPMQPAQPQVQPLKVTPPVPAPAPPPQPAATVAPYPYPALPAGQVYPSGQQYQQPPQPAPAAVAQPPAYGAQAAPQQTAQSTAAYYGQAGYQTGYQTSYQ
eukprot:evm.model.scf_216.3 EVM.evm.TU.scf_216.3   scf_216:34271-35665(+)